MQGKGWIRFRGIRYDTVGKSATHETKKDGSDPHCHNL
jgi:hypothetical protein